jgi:transcriptional regulator with PAS, ATPase and Fis domain
MDIGSGAHRDKYPARNMQNPDLEVLSTAVAEGRFREDLYHRYYRLNVVTIALPPLRDRRDDIPLRVQRFLGRRSQKPVSIRQDALNKILTHHWRGVRELENVIIRAVVLVCNKTGSDVQLRPATDLRILAQCDLQPSAVGPVAFRRA